MRQVSRRTCISAPVGPPCCSDRRATAGSREGDFMSNTRRAVTVLIADDYAAARRFLTELLQGCGMRVIGEAADGCEAVLRCLQLQPQVVVLDISMPLLDGFGAARQIAQLSPETRIVFLSAHAGQEFVRE